MPTDNQPDKKEARVKKNQGQIPITEEAQNKNPNAKKQSAKESDV